MADALFSLFRKAPAFWASLLIVVATAAGYWPVRRFGFVHLDDYWYVYLNPHTLSGLSLANIKWAFTDFYTTNYEPVTWLSYLLDDTLFGATPHGLHVENVLIHTTNSVLLFLWLLRATGQFWPSWAVGALLAVHPTHVESVAWISERKDVLFLFFCLLCLHCYLRYARSRLFDATAYFATLILFACGLLSKAMLMSFPAVLLLVDLWPLNRLRAGTAEEASRARFPSITLRRAVLEKLPFLVLALIDLRVESAAQGTIAASYAAIPISLRAQNAALSYAGYVVESIWPFNLSVLYPYRWEIPTRAVVLSVLLLVGITIIVLLPRLRRRSTAVGWFWFVGTLIPAMGIVQVGRQSMADRYLYLPSIGLYCWIVWQAVPLADRVGRWATGLTLGTILVFLTILTRQQVGYWVNTDVLYQRASLLLNGYAGDQIRLAELAIDRGDRPDAQTHFRSALQSDPQNYAAHFNLGNLLLAAQPAQAIPYYQAAAQEQPGSPEVQVNWGVALAKIKDYPDAAAHFRQAESLDPDSYDAHFDFGRLLLLTGNPAAARAELSAALRLRPGDPNATRVLQSIR